MVFFTCNACGESLKKAQVDKHVMKCRGCQVLSCIDCGKDFWGEDYKNHVKCISEDQKYGGKGYEAKANKGDVKQQQWLQRINEAMSKPGVSAKLRDVLHQVSAYENVPRKKAKFQNWMRNSLKIANPGLQEEVWDIIAAADSAPPTAQPTKEPAVCVDTNGTENHADQSNTDAKKKLNKRERKEARQQKNGKASKRDEKRTAEEEPEKCKKNKKDRKRKHEEDDQTEDGVDNEDVKKTKFDETADDLMSEETEDQAVPQGKFNWKGNIKAVLRESSDQELSVKKLRKKVLAAYYSFTGGSNFKTEEEVLALFNKKITKNPKFRVLKDKVKLVQ